MLRYLAATLLVINIVLFAWMQGWIINSPQQQGRSPERLENQILPHAIHVLSLPEQSTYTSNTTQPDTPVQTASSPGTPLFFCIEAAPLSDEQSTQLQHLVRQITPSVPWRTDTYTAANSWAVYLGPYTNDDTAQKRQQELRLSNIESNLVQGKPEFQPGITLGLFREYGNAEKALAQVHEQGIQNARLVVWSQAPQGHILRITEITEKQREQLYELTRNSNTPTFEPCET